MYPPVVEPTILRQAVTDKLCRNRYVYAFVAKNGKRLDSERGAFGTPHTCWVHTCAQRPGGPLLGACPEDTVAKTLRADHGNPATSCKAERSSPCPAKLKGARLGPPPRLPPSPGAGVTPWSLGLPARRFQTPIYFKRKHIKLNEFVVSQTWAVLYM